MNHEINVKELRVCDDVEKYIISEVIGEGSYGKVYLGTRISGNAGEKKLVALKFFGYITGDRVCKPDFDSIDREVMLMASLLGVAGTSLLGVQKQTS
jgi:serine/threonine protein kinase